MDLKNLDGWPACYPSMSSKKQLDCWNHQLDCLDEFSWIFEFNCNKCQLPLSPGIVLVVLATVLLVLAEMILILFRIRMMFLNMTVVVPAAEVRCCPNLAILCFLTKLVDQHSILLAFPCFRRVFFLSLEHPAPFKSIYSQVACHILGSSIDSSRSTREIWAEYYLEKKQREILHDSSNGFVATHFEEAWIPGREYGAKLKLRSVWVIAVGLLMKALPFIEIPMPRVRLPSCRPGIIKTTNTANTQFTMS